MGQIQHVLIKHVLFVCSAGDPTQPDNGSEGRDPTLHSASSMDPGPVVRLPITDVNTHFLIPGQSDCS